MHIVRSPTVIVDMGPVVALLDSVEVHHDEARRRLDAQAPPLLAPA